MVLTWRYCLGFLRVMGVEIKIWEKRSKEETSGNINIPGEGKKKRSETFCGILREYQEEFHQKSFRCYRKSVDCN